MLERELKFHVPNRQRTSLKAQLRKLGADSIELHARYYDTRDQTLAKAGIALRIRREGDQWVQTLKSPGPDELSRIELNHPRAEPVLDLTVYSDSHFASIVASAADRLRCRYITHVTRQRLVVATDSGTAELAYDEGMIVAGGIMLPLHELEIEHIDGETSDLFALARLWLQRHRLILELRSKAARGDALAALAAAQSFDTAWDPDTVAQGGKSKPRMLNPRQVEHLAAAIRANAPILSTDVGMGAAYLTCANECMSQIIRNSSFLAGVDGMKPERGQRIEYVHQIRVGIRRLRTCWKLFGKAADLPETIETQLIEHFRELGQARDDDVIQTEVLPRLMQAGMPPDTTQPNVATNPTATPRALLAASPDFQESLLDLLEHLVDYGDTLQERKDDKPALIALPKRLNKWLDGIRHDSQGFLEAGWDERHRLRKRVKRLRYGMEFSQGLMDSRRLGQLRDALVSAQKSLGHLNDLYVAAQYYRGDGARHPSAMFALGWLAATQEHEGRAAHTALQALAQAGSFSSARRKPSGRKR